MKVDNNVIEIDSHIAFVKKKKMSLSKNNIPHVIRALTTYSNPVVAVAREYLSNAYDATVARMGRDSGGYGLVLDKPVEITLPSTFGSDFIVRDYGVGMSGEFIDEIFSVYGDSMKLGTNDEIGGFGMGAKSALSLVSQFVIVSVQNGKKTTAIIQKDTDGVGSVNFLPESETDEENGTTVRIPVPKESIHEMNAIFKDGTILMGYPHGSVLVNGVVPSQSVYNTELYTAVAGGNGWVSKKLSAPWRVSDLKILVGPVFYKVPAEDIQSLAPDNMQGFTENFVLNIPIGSVEFTVTRDNLAMTDKTKRTLVETLEALYSDYAKEISDSLEDCESYHSALLATESLYRTEFQTGRVTYRGEALPGQDRFVVDVPTLVADASEADGEPLCVLHKAGRNQNAVANRPYSRARIGVASSDNISVLITDMDSAEKVKTFLSQFALIHRTFRKEYGFKTAKQSVTFFHSPHFGLLNKWEVAKFNEVVTLAEIADRVQALKDVEREERRLRKEKTNTTVSGGFYLKSRSLDGVDSKRANTYTSTDYILLSEEQANNRSAELFFSEDRYTRLDTILGFQEVAKYYTRITNRALTLIVEARSAKTETIHAVLQAGGSRHVSVEALVDVFFGGEQWQETVEKIQAMSPVIDSLRASELSVPFYDNHIVEFFSWARSFFPENETAKNLLKETEIKSLKSTHYASSIENSPTKQAEQVIAFFNLLGHKVEKVETRPFTEEEKQFISKYETPLLAAMSIFVAQKEWLLGSDKTSPMRDYAESLIVSAH